MGLLRHLVHDLILNKINKMAAFFHLLLLPIAGFRRILYSCPTNLSDGEHTEQPVQWPTGQQQQLQQPVILEQLIATQNQLMQVVLHTLNN
jgi:hypothetical protein